MSVSLAKASDASPYGGHSTRTSYMKKEDGTVPEYVLMGRRYDRGARVSQEWSYYLRNNDLRELQGYYRHG